MNKSRRQFLGLSAAALAGVTLVPSLVSCNAEKAAPAAAPSDGKISSTFNGVAIGTITYSWRGMQPGIENLIKNCKDSLISNLELMGGDLEGCLGIPENPTMRIMQAAMAAQRPAGGGAGGPGAPAGGQRPGGGGAPAGPGGPGGFRRPTFTPEQQAEIDKYNEEVKKFRRNMDWDKVEAVRKRLADEGISVHIVKTQPSGYDDPEDIDYAFKLAKAMGAVGVTDEMSQAAAEKIAPYAEKHDMYYILHNHMQYATEEFMAGPDKVLAVSPKIMLNFDMGHYFGSTGKHPLDFIKKYGDRIVNLHIKDKTGPNAEEPNANQVWGQGQTPLEDVLLYLRDNKVPIFPDIELEYTVKPWSNSVEEVATCVKYARQILM